MAVDAAVEAPQDPAARGFNGRLLSPVDPPASGEPLSREWLAQVGRSAGGEYLDGRLVLKRLTEDGLAVPGNDPLYQYLGVFRLYGEIFKAQHEEQMAALRSMLDEARQAMARSLADASAGGAAAAAARRVEDEALGRRRCPVIRCGCKASRGDGRGARNLHRGDCRGHGRRPGAD